MEKLKQLPIGVQTFKKMRERDYVYIDKISHKTRRINGWKIKELD